MNKSLVSNRPQTVPAFKLAQNVIEKCNKNEADWREKVKTEINTNVAMINKSDRSIFYGKSTDPLTNLRDVLRNLSNAESFIYMRQCRLMVAKLRKCWVDINEEVKSLTKNKEYLESAIESIRKDLIINNETIENRKIRPVDEPNPDTVDLALSAERQSLLTMKKELELILKPIQEFLQRLDEIRENVFKLTKERSVVTDLICQCLTQSLRSYDRVVEKAKIKSQNDLALSFKSASVNYNDASVNALPTGPLTAFTEESVEIIKEATEMIHFSKELRYNSNIKMKECIENAKNIGDMVNKVFTKKIQDCLALNRSLNLSNAENELAFNRAQRWQKMTEISYKYSLGPEKTRDLFTYERLDRPIIKTVQKHPGNQFPDAKENAKGSDVLKESNENTLKNMKTLKIIGQKLDASAQIKTVQYSLDSGLLRKRREKVNHQWVPVNYVKEK